MTVDADCNVLERHPLHQRRSAAGDFDALDAPPHAAARFVERLAMLGCDGPGEFVEALFEERLELVKHLRPRVDRSVTPCRKRPRGGLNGGIDVRGGREWRSPDHFADGRIADVEKVLGVGGNPASANEVVEDGGVSMSRHGSPGHWVIG
jgi:hypothetical protein